MARNNFSLSTSADFLSGVAAKTILQLVAPAAQMLAVKGFGLGFKGTVTTQTPIVVELLRQTTAGTMTARTPLKKSAGGPAVQSTGQENATVEPTAADVVFSIAIHPQAAFEKNFRPDDEIILDGGTRLGLRVTADTTTNLRAHIDFEE